LLNRTTTACRAALRLGPSHDERVSGGAVVRSSYNLEVPDEHPPQKRALKNARKRRAIPGDSLKKGGILAALRRSPLVGAELDISRTITHGRQWGVMPR
jgi:hypothetical protein